MTAVAKLDAMKRIAAFVAVREKMAGTDPEVITESNGVPLLMSDLRAALSPAELGGVETEQSIAADCYHWIAECIGTLPGYSVQEHVQTMKETLDACSDFLHDFVPSDEGGCDEAVELARNCRAVLSGRIDQYEPTPRAAEAVSEEVQDAVDSILSQLGGWAKAYPLDIFSEPTDEEREWLHTTKPGLMDRIAASMGRHMSKCIAEDLAALTASLTPPSAKEEL